jgi:aspartokinase-like uncharacterized kinase
MAILAMEQFGWLLSDLIVGVPVLLPAGLPLDELPASWAVTSDSIAAWVAHRVGADRLVLVKAGPGVDEYFPTAIQGARFETSVITPEELLDDPLLPWPHG